MTKITLTRVFMKKGASKVSSQSVTVRKEEIAMARPSNRLGKAYQHATVTLKSGVQIDVKDTVASLRLDSGSWGTFASMKRVYLQKAKTKGGKGTLKSQTVLVRKAEIAMVRASNRLGYPDHRATVTLASGVQIDTADTADKVNTYIA